MSKAGRRALFFLSIVSVVVVSAKMNIFAAERSSKPTPVRIATVSRSTLDLPFFVARDRGFFREEGLEVEIILMRSNLTLQAMVARSIDFGTATGAAVNAIVNGADVRVVLAMSDKPLFDLIAHPSITRVQQLRGKKIGVGGIGSLSEIIIRQVLSANQIPPDQVNFLQLGQNSLTYAALKSGLIDAHHVADPADFSRPG
jgi:NitT/TauT family transport system substrate-binding protein